MLAFAERRNDPGCYISNLAMSARITFPNASPGIKTGWDVVL